VDRPGPILLLRAVDEQIGPQGLGEGEFGRGGADDDHTRPGQLGHLDGSGVHPARGAHDEDNLAGLHSAPRDQRVPGGVEDQARCSRGAFIEALGQRQEVHRRDRDVFCECSPYRLSKQVPLSAEVISPRQTVGTPAAAQIGVDNHPLTDGQTLNAFTQGRHLPSAVGPRDVGKRQTEPRPTLPHPDVEPIQRRGVQADERLARPRFRGRNLIQLKDFWASVLMKEDGLQWITSGRLR